MEIYQIAEQKIRAELQSRFVKATVLLSESVEGYIHGLQGMGAYLRAYDFNPDQNNMTDYSDFRNDFNNFPGALGFGFIRRISSSELPNYLLKVKQKSPFFNFRELTNNSPDNFIIEFSVPVAKNGPAIGLNIGSEHKRRLAAEFAMRTSKATLTSPIILVQADKRGSGFLYLLPLYRSAKPPNNSQELERDLVGWAYTPILAEEMFQKVLKLSDKIWLKVTDVTDPKHSEHIFEGGIKEGDVFDFIKQLPIGGRIWLVEAQLPIGLYLSQLGTVLAASVLLLSLVAFFIIKWLVDSLIKAKDTEEKFKDIESWREAILKGTNYFMIATDPQGLITVFNKAAEQALGYSSDEMIREKTVEILHDPSEVVERTETLKRELNLDFAPGFETFVIKSRLTGLPDTNEWTYITKEKRRIPVRLSVTTMLNQQNKILGYLGVAEDISSVLEMKKSLEMQRALMFSSSKLSSLGEMAAGIAHEINNPLAIIVGNATILKESIEGDKPKDQLLKINMKIKETALRIAKIIKGLRAFSRDGSTDPMVRTKISAILDDVLSLCQQRLKNNQIELNLTGDLDLEIYCRPVEISQILINLILNSFDAISNKESKWISVHVKQDNKMARIEVVDSGNGIPEAFASKIMNPFFTTKDVGIGTGLGLSVANGIAEKHSGKLTHAALRTNTTFILELPICKT